MSLFFSAITYIVLAARWHHKKRCNISASLARTPVPPKVNARKSEHAACGVCTRWRWPWRNNVVALGPFANFMATLELNFPASYARGCPIDGTFRMPLKQSVSSSADSNSDSISDSDSLEFCYRRYGIVVIDSSLCAFYDAYKHFNKFYSFSAKTENWKTENRRQQADKWKARKSTSKDLFTWPGNMQAKEIKPKWAIKCR